MRYQDGMNYYAALIYLLNHIFTHPVFTWCHINALSLNNEQWIRQWLLVSRSLQFSRNLKYSTNTCMCEELSCQSSPSEKNLLNPSISINFFQPTPAQAAILSYVDHSHGSLTTPQQFCPPPIHSLQGNQIDLQKKFKSYYVTLQLKNFKGSSSCLGSKSLIFKEPFSLFQSHWP